MNVLNPTTRLLAATMLLALGMPAMMAPAQESPVPKKPSPPAQEEEKADKEEKPKVARVGKPAPNFALKDTRGKAHQLSSYAGNFVVLEWFNPGCPYCRGIYDKGVVEDIQKKIRQVDPDFVYLAINSTANQPKDFIITQSDEFLEKQEMKEIPVLLDYEGTVGRLYEARTTPHMFVIDPEGTLIYAGAITDDRNFDKDDKATNYVINAVRSSVSGIDVAPGTVRPWGCSVKYPDGGKGRKPRGRGPGRKP